MVLYFITGGHKVSYYGNIQRENLQNFTFTLLKIGCFLCSGKKRGVNIHTNDVDGGWSRFRHKDWNDGSNIFMLLDI